jgi:hypothetical protein
MLYPKGAPSGSQMKEPLPELDQPEMSTRVNKMLTADRRLVALEVVRSGSRRFFHWRGLQSIASHTAVTRDMVFRWHASCS